MSSYEKTLIPQSRYPWGFHDLGILQLQFHCDAEVSAWLTNLCMHERLLQDRYDRILSDMQTTVKTYILHQWLNCAGNLVVFPLTLDSLPQSFVFPI